jgi:hypothetical protein
MPALSQPAFSLPVFLSSLLLFSRFLSACSLLACALPASSRFCLSLHGPQIPLFSRGELRVRLWRPWRQFTGLVTVCPHVLYVIEMSRHIVVVDWLARRSCPFWLASRGNLSAERSFESGRVRVWLSLCVFFESYSVMFEWLLGSISCQWAQEEIFPGGRSSPFCLRFPKEKKSISWLLYTRRKHSRKCRCSRCDAVSNQPMFLSVS